MKATINSVTGKPEVKLAVKLLSISNNILENKNGKGYRPCTIETKDKNNNTQKVSGIMYESNFAHGVTIGSSYAAVASLTEQGVLITVSHLEIASRPTEELFDFSIDTSNISEVAKEASNSL